MTNAELIEAYDANQSLTMPRMFADQDKEHHGQCFAVETLRELIASGITIDGWNALEDAFAWAKILMAAVERARENVAAPHVGFDISDGVAAGSYGGNYFEHTYQFIIDNTGPGDRIVFTKIGGVQ